MTDTRTRILEEATRQLAEGSYATFTVASVRDALGISSGSMFHAFASKAALAAAVYVTGMAHYQRIASAALARGNTAELAVRSLIRAHLGWVEDHRGLARFLFSTLPEEVMSEAAAPLAAHNAAFYAALDAFYASLVAARLMPKLEMTVAHAICMGPVQEYCRQWVRSRVLEAPRRVAPLLENAALAGLASARTKKAHRRAKGVDA